MKKRLNQRGFTLMELMVVIVIVAILAAVAVPLYINYVKDAQRTEAKGAIAAIITAEQVHLQKYGEYLPYTDGDFKSPPKDPKERLDVDLSEARQKWSFDVTTTDATKDFKVVASPLEEKDRADLTVTYKHDRANAENTGWEEGTSSSGSGTK